MIVRLNFDGAKVDIGKLVMTSIGVAGYVDGVSAPAITIGEVVGYGTSNTAEWTGLCKALEFVVQLSKEQKQVMDVSILGDSQLVVYQFIGKYKVRQPHLKEYYDKAKALFNSLHTEQRRRISVRWIPREKNKEADKLAGDALKSFLAQNKI